MKNIMLCVACAVFMICICVIGSDIGKKSEPADAKIQTDKTTAEETAAEKPKPKSVDELIENMSVEEKVCQLFIVTPEAILTGSNETAELNGENTGAITALAKGDEDALNKYHIGGIIMFASNIETPKQIAEFNSDISAACSIAPFICIDEEGGLVARIGNNENFDVSRYESMRDIGSTKELESAESVGVEIGTYLKEYGFNLDLAPVSDLDLGNPAIGSRAFSDGPRLTGNMVKNEINGFHSVGVMCCAKHFPGHGSPTGDTHNGVVDIEKDWDELCESDIIPFKYAIAADVDMIMVGHLSTPYITDDGLPASLSREMISDKLRGELGYSGVVITDAFAMGAITEEYTSAYAAVTAIKAGADIVLMPQSIDEAYTAVLDAVNSGDITEDDLNEHVRRILTLKEKYGLIDFN